MKQLNPWRGLASYRDPSQYKDSDTVYKFCGRDRDTTNLVKLIDNNLFVTLYGRTGVGKTSLLNAGVFPILRQHGYCPIYVRLLHEAIDRNYSEAIVEKIRSCGLNECRNTSVEANDSFSDTFLWKYFCTTKFENDEGTEIYPVIVLDQFEEIFYTDREKAELLIRQIYLLISDELLMPKESGYSDETNYRFVASIREDNLFLLEDSIDNLSLSVLKSNRYRLRPLSRQNAEAVILGPGEKFISVGESQQIVNRIIDIATEKDGSISSLILSLICSLMYEKAKESSSPPQIKFQQIPDTPDGTDKILVDYYLDNTTKQQRKVIEKELLTEDGHRCPAVIPISLVNKLLSEECRLLQQVETEDGKRIELVHDRLAKVIYENRRKTDANKFRTLLKLVISAILGLVGWAAIVLSWSSTKYHSSNALYTKEKPTSNSIYIETDSTDCNIPSSSLIKRIYIGKNVKKVNLENVLKEGISINVDKGNTKLKWDSLWSPSTGIVGYLHYTDSPNEALYMQDFPSSSNADVRLPKGVKVLKSKYHEYFASPTLPPLGAKIARLTSSNVTFKGDELIEEVYIETDSIPDMCFKDCSNLKRVHFGSVKSLGIEAFAGCLNLKEVDFSKSEEVMFGRNAFNGCIRLEKVRMPRMVTGNTSMLFANCFSLKKVILPNVVSSSLDETMFYMCFNLMDIQNPTDDSIKSPFVKKEDGVWYYSDVPIVSNGLKQRKWSFRDSLYYTEGPFICTKLRSTRMGEIFNIIQASVKDWQEESGCKKFIVNNNSSLTCFIVSEQENSVLFLPYFNYQKNPEYNGDQTINSGKRVEYICFVFFDKLTEIHIPIADPIGVSINFMGSYRSDMNKITLYVPYGSQEAYERSGMFSDFKEIKSETKMQRYLLTLRDWAAGIKYTYEKHSILLYSLTLLAFLFLYVISYRVRIKQMKVIGKVNRKNALYDGIITVVIAFVSFLPVYWLTFVYLNNYCVYMRSYNINVILSCSMGCLAALCCTYIFVYAGKGDIWKKWI